MVCWRFTLACAFGAFVFLSGCSDEGSTDAIVTNTSSDSDVPPASNIFVGGSPVIITEIDPTNLVYKDHEGGDAGWIELFNPSDTVVNLAGISLTDDLNEPQKWTFGNVVVPPQGFMLVFMSGKDLPDYESPHDSTSLSGGGCWTWTDSQNEPVAGSSTATNLPGQSRQCFRENGMPVFGGVVQFGENEELGWSSVSFFVGASGGSKTDVVDISNANELLLTGFISEGRKLEVRFTQPDLDDWLGWPFELVGTGDSNTTYNVPLPTGTKFPDLENIYGTRFSPANQEYGEITFKITSYVARNRGHEPHANFKLHKKGGALYVMNAAGGMMDSLTYPKIPVGKSWSFGALSEAAVGRGFATPTPFGLTPDLVVPVQSPAIASEWPPSGFYKQPFAVSFPVESAVHCAEGGGLPTELSPTVTNLSISKTTVLRCASFVPGTLPGEVQSRTYVFEDQPTIASVFITGDPLSLFDPDTGLYMPGPNAQDAEPHYGANYWQDKELSVFVELLESGVNAPAFAENAGFQIFGNYSRAKDKKSVAIVFREKYGEKRLKYPLFPEFPELQKFKVFILRNNGGNFEADYIHDRLASSISEGLGIDYQRGRPAIVFYNGEYYGIHNIRERSNEYYFETHYGYDPDAIDLLKADNSVSNGSASDYKELENWIEGADLKSEADYSYVASRIDVNNFLNYVQTEIFVNNRDWPGNNLKKWRSNNPKTLWKWFLYDMDFGFGNNYSEYTNNIFEFVTAEDGESWPNGPQYTFLLRKLLENDGFRQAFVNRMATLLSMNFESSRLLARINTMMAEIEAEIPRDQERWGLSTAYMAQTLEDMKNFAASRQGEILEEMMQFFGFSEIAEQTLSVTGGGQILVHNLPLDRNSMTVRFFKDYPVVVSAQPVSGGVFVGWSDGSTEAVRVVIPGEIAELTAIFK